MVGSNSQAVRQSRRVRVTTSFEIVYERQHVRISAFERAWFALPWVTVNFKSSQTKAGAVLGSSRKRVPQHPYISLMWRRG